MTGYFFRGLECGWFARVDACHGEGLAGFERDVVALFAGVDCLPLAQIPRGHHATRTHDRRLSAAAQRHDVVHLATTPYVAEALAKTARAKEANDHHEEHRTRDRNDESICERIAKV